MMVIITADDGAGEIFRHPVRRTGILRGRVQTGHADLQLEQ
ncbi:hypothetical protein [Pseudomonas triclosanedens]|uniref:Uncharacterized protein n=1 Tax=Pseudomonas triclosanedens TaxID=2961893 RepID=A0ABY7A7Q3_9PSED|nr:hypothetical protein [Pseudomonas triclosanedens]WAI52119.1 hypothetical protein OU419_13000 [Pseudomonas triclosanedens]